MFNAFNLHVCVPLHSPKGVDDVALRANKKIKFVLFSLFVNDQGLQKGKFWSAEEHSNCLCGAL